MQQPPIIDFSFAIKNHNADNNLFAIYVTAEPNNVFGNIHKGNEFEYIYEETMYTNPNDSVAIDFNYTLCTELQDSSNQSKHRSTSFYQLFIHLYRCY